MQCTLRDKVSFSGIGLHTGKEIACTVGSGEPDTGIVFFRVDIANTPIPARYSSVCDTNLCTVISDGHGSSVSTIEHIMSAFYAMGIHNAEVYLDGPEVPIMDGSAIEFVRMFQEVGLKPQSVPEKRLVVKNTVEVKEGQKYVRLLPSDTTFFDCAIDFAASSIGVQRFTFDMSCEDYSYEIASARTFGFASEIKKLQQMGLAKGASLQNAIGIGEDGAVMNEGGLRYDNEFVRHKVLDIIGDLYTSGYRLVCKVEANQPSHKLNNLVLRHLFESETAYEICS